MNEQKTVTLNNGVKMPVAGIGTFLLSPDEAEASVLSALQGGLYVETVTSMMHRSTSNQL